MKWIGLGTTDRWLPHRATASQHRSSNVRQREGVNLVERTRDEAKLWPEPLLQFNPAIGIQNDQILSGDTDHRHLHCAANRIALGARRSGFGRVATKIIGSAIPPRNSAHEFFSRSRHFAAHVPSRVELASAIDAGIDVDLGAFDLMLHPVGAWLETAIAFDRRDDRFVLAPPRSVAALGDLLALDADRGAEQCAEFLQQFLSWISAVKMKMNGGGGPRTLPRFQLHQFISISGTVFSTLDQRVKRLGSHHAEDVQIDRATHKPIYRNVFSRATGVPLVCVSQCGGRLLPRDFWERSDEQSGATDGYLIIDDELWSPEDDYDLLPAAWMRQTAKGQVPKAKYAPYMPTEVHFDEYGNCADSASLMFFGWFIRAPLLFDPTCPTL